MTNILRTGVVKTSHFTNSLLSKYDSTLYQEPDGSIWIRIFHHNNPANAFFASTDTFSSSVYLDANRWFNVSILNLIINNTYELMIKEMLASGGTEVKYRWIQTVNPMTAAFGDVDKADVTKITTTGYSNASSYGGIYYKNSNTYLCANDSKSGDWMGAIGSWKLSNNGLSAYGTSTRITTGYLDLYTRVDNQKLNGCSIFNEYIKATDFIEH